jgi:hypothetical protein
MSKESEIEIILEDFEEKLEIFKYSSAYMDRLAYRNSRNKRMSETQFERFFDSLKKIESKDNVKNFFRLFYDHESQTYETRLLSTTGILLGLAEVKEKASLLFENYDDDTNRKLSRDQVRSMIIDIFYVSCFCIPAFASKNSVGFVKDSIERYKNRLGVMKNGICNHLVNLIFEDFEGEEISLDEFKELTMKRKVKEILEVRSFRRVTKRIFSMIERAALTADYYLNNEKNYKMQVEMLGLAQNNSKKRNSLE